MTYQQVLDALDTHNIEWNDIDRIHLREASHNEFRERASMGTSNYSTDERPAVRRTNGVEKIFFTDSTGEMREIEL